MTWITGSSYTAHMRHLLTCLPFSPVVQTELCNIFHAGRGRKKKERERKRKHKKKGEKKLFGQHINQDILSQSQTGCWNSDSITRGLANQMTTVQVRKKRNKTTLPCRFFLPPNSKFLERPRQQQRTNACCGILSLRVAVAVSSSDPSDDRLYPSRHALQKPCCTR